MGNLSDIAEAISAHQKAVELTPIGHAYLPQCFSNLGNSYLSHFDCTGNPSDIAEAISAHQKAVELSPTGHAELPGYFNNLGNSYLLHFQSIGNLSDIAEAISAHQKAVELTPFGHAQLAGYYISLAHTFYKFSLVPENHGNLERSLFYYKSAASLDFASPSTRLKAAKEWAQLAFKYYDQSPETLIAFDTVMSCYSKGQF
jgi:tetratricopeptide (TPR) repeat protein